MSDLASFGAWVGLLGGFSGFIALIIQFRSVYIQSPRVRCKSSWAINPDSEISYLNISLTNRGNQSIEVLNIGIQYENKKHSPFTIFVGSQRIGSDLPTTLLPHSQLNWYLDHDAVLVSSKANGDHGSVKCYVNLGNGKTKRSHKYWFEPKNKRNFLSILNHRS